MFLKIAFFCGLTYFDNFDFFLSVFLVWNSTRNHVSSHLQNCCGGDKPLVEPTEVPPSAQKRMERNVGWDLPHAEQKVKN